MDWNRRNLIGASALVGGALATAARAQSTPPAGLSGTPQAPVTIRRAAGAGRPAVVRGHRGVAAGQGSRRREGHGQPRGAGARLAGPPRPGGDPCHPADPGSISPRQAQRRGGRVAAGRGLHAPGGRQGRRDGRARPHPGGHHRVRAQLSPAGRRLGRRAGRAAAGRAARGAPDPRRRRALEAGSQAASA
jgi:hypothetical protein